MVSSMAVLVLPNFKNLPTTPEFLSASVEFLQEVVQLIRSCVENSSTPVQAAPKPAIQQQRLLQPRLLLSLKTVIREAIPEFGWKRVVVPHEKPLARRYTTGVLHGNNFYVFGGMSPSKALLNDLYSSLI